MQLFNRIMSTHDIPTKPRRKKLDVPIHQKIPEEKNPEMRRTFSANFNAKRHKDKSKNALFEDPEDMLNRRLSRRHLTNENARLSRENEEIRLKFNELEELSVRKITKLREKVQSLQAISEQITTENNFLKGQNQELIETMDDFRIQLELSKHCKHCDELRTKLENLNGQHAVLQKTKTEMEEDVNMLKTVVFRLNQQLERYQEKLRSFNLKNNQQSIQSAQSHDNISVVENKDVPFLSEVHKDHSHTPISWGKVNVHTLGPLLDAYQDTITEKDEIIQNYEAELSIFTGRLKEIIQENEHLHKSLTVDDECSSKLKIELDHLRREVKDLKQQNDLLIKKCALKQDKLEEVLKCYEQKVELLKRDYSVLHEQYCRGRTEILALKEKNNALDSSLEDLKTERQNYIPLSVHASSVNECKRLYEELKRQYEQEKQKLKENLDACEKQKEILQKNISTEIRHKEELELQLKNSEKLLKKNESQILEAEHALNEAQFSKTACRKQLHKAMSFAKDLVAEQETLLKALNQRQQENKAVKKFGCDIASRMDSLRNQLKDVQRDAWQELSTVEKRILEQNQTMETMKSEHIQEIERLQNIIKEQEAGNLVLKEQSALPTSQYLLFREKHK